MDVKQNFIHWYFEQFRLEHIYEQMASTVEDSPWHRERNVGVHTDMVVAEYLSRSDPFDVRGALACAFHDVGKPPAEVIKHREDRGEYRAYYGHEQVSARMWEDYVCTNWINGQEWFNLIPDDIYAIGWMIEHHVPWMHKKDDKLNAFARTAVNTLGAESDTWTNMLLADQYGRISDPSHQRGEEATVWVDDHKVRKIQAEHHWENYGDKLVYMLVGPPGCGKSTYRAVLTKSLEREGYSVGIVSMDDLRIEWYSKPKQTGPTISDYQVAWQASTEDKRFKSKVDKRYIEALREHECVIVDNTNCFQKPRRKWLAPARARDFNIVAVVFPSTLRQITDRNGDSRKDKMVPVHVAENFYNKLQLPLFGDFDNVIVVDGNLPT